MTTLPGTLVDTGWLEEHLNDGGLVILDCTVFLAPAKDPNAPKNGREAWGASHIPGSAYADLARDLSDPDAAVRFMRPSAEQFSSAMSALGVGEGGTVVCYDGAGSMWAARVWWMLRSFGFDNAAVLDGGARKWKAEGRPLSTDPAPATSAQFVARPREGLFATKEDVLAAIEDGQTCVINALGEDIHTGETSSPYGRDGHITSSVNVAAMSLVDPDTYAYRPLEEIREMFAATGALERERAITYCGGGIAASSDALMLTMLGHQNVAVYDASLLEWAADSSLPMEVGS
jgi:thiosulfate/3-mercaptopyruvate sulfurtransferase